MRSIVLMTGLGVKRNLEERVTAAWVVPSRAWAAAHMSAAPVFVKLLAPAVCPCRLESARTPVRPGLHDVARVPALRASTTRRDALSETA